MIKYAFKISTKSKNILPGLVNAIVSHGDDVLTLGAEAATRVVWNFPWHWRKRSPKCVCQQTSPKQKETKQILKKYMEIQLIQRKREREIYT